MQAMARDRQLARLLRCACIVLCIALPGWGQETALMSPLGVNAHPDHQADVVTGGRLPLRPQIAYDQGLLTISADNSSLAKILDAVRMCMEASIEFPVAASSERATVRIGPAPPAKVLAELLRGSPFDYLIVSAGAEPGRVRVVLSEKTVPGEPPGPTEARVAQSPPAVAVAEAADSGRAPNTQVQPNDETPLMGDGAWGDAPPVAVPPDRELTPQELARKMRPSKESPRYFPPLKKQP
jgi:hypothetical protein